MLVLIKIGGSLITKKSEYETVNYEVLTRIANEINEIKNNGINLIVGHGGGSFPHRAAKKYRTDKGIIDETSYMGIAKVQDAASRLNRVFVSELIKAGQNAISVQLSSSAISKNKRIDKWFLDPIKQMLYKNLLPVPYGDVSIDTENGCCIISTEEILFYLAKELKPDKILIVGKTDGVFTGDPSKNNNVKHIPEINSNNFEEIKKYLLGSDATDVTGGMFHKVERMLELAKQGYPSHIINGMIPGNIKKAILGEDIGTIIKL